MKKKTIKKVVVSGALASISLQSLGTGFAATKTYEVGFSTKENQQRIPGAEYELEQVGGKYNPVTGLFEDGSHEKVTIVMDGSENEIMPQDWTITETPNSLDLRLPEGTYKMKMTKAPTGYYKTFEDIQFHLPATKPDGSGHLDKLEINQKMSKILKQITLRKTSDGTNETLDGVKFKLYRSTTMTGDLQDVNDWQEYTHIPTGANEWEVTNGNIIINDLPYGRYYFEEISTVADYELTKEKVHFTVQQESPDPRNENLALTATVTNYKSPTVEKTVVGTQKAGTQVDPHIAAKTEVLQYRVSVLIPKDIESYKRFAIVDTLAPGLSFQSVDSIKVRGDNGTDHKDTFVANRLNEGFQNADLDNIDNPENLVFAFNKEQNGVISDTVTNAQLTGQELSVLAPFAGKTIDIIYNVLVDAPNAGQEMKNAVGVDYKNQWDVTGKKEDEFYSKTPSNTIKITKVDGQDTQIKLENFKFELYLGKKEEGGTLIGTEKTTNDQGQITWDNLINGTYYLYETSVPAVVGDEAGYRLLHKPIEIVLTGDAADVNEVNKEIKNFKTNVQMPNTGFTGAVGSIILGSGVLLIAKSSKKKEEE